ncbi:hypothetical protein HDV00_002156 [Rhizophlyctis rosea]|nr:hypothetical protein HDV00_002156 [Rhizophlyctis rosea]
MMREGSAETSGLIVDVKTSSGPQIIKEIANVLNTEVQQRAGRIPDLTSRIYFGFWEPAYMLWAWQYLPRFKLSYIGWDMAVANAYLAHTDVESFNLYYDPVRNDTTGFVRRAKRAERQVFVWTIDDKEHMIKARKLSVDAVLTNRPDICLEL